jgi:hypothetical protein
MNSNNNTTHEKYKNAMAKLTNILLDVPIQDSLHLGKLHKISVKHYIIIYLELKISSCAKTSPASILFI